MYRCRGCGAGLDHELVDLGPSPFSNAFVDGPDDAEMFYPLRAFVCEVCFLVQIPAVANPADIFNDRYAYFSSANAAFVEHARTFAENAIATLGLDRTSHVVEVASNDGYLLRQFKAHDIAATGYEPSESVAAVARQSGITTLVQFFGAATAGLIPPADLIVANNVIAHVPDLHDFVEGLRIALKPGGRISIEFPHVLKLLEQVQFDQIYHEHYSYFSLLALEPVLAEHGLAVERVELLPTHGGSLRLWVEHVRSQAPYVSPEALGETAFGLREIATYDRFKQRVQNCRSEAVRFFLDVHESGRTIAGYGAPAKAATFLNFCGIRRDLLPWTCDNTPRKIGRYIPGARIPIFPEEHIAEDPPDYLVLLAWNWKAEMTRKAREQFGFTGHIVTAIPHVEID